MGNCLRGKKRTATVMTIDGTTFHLKPPAHAGNVLRDHPGCDLLEAEEVKQLNVRARPLDSGDPLKPGKIYFLVELPWIPDHRAPRRACSGAISANAADRLESLKLYRRSVSDVLLAKPAETQEGVMRLRVKLPKVQVAKLMEECKDAGEVAQKIMELFIEREKGTAPPPDAAVVAVHTRRKEVTFMSEPKGSNSVSVSLEGLESLFGHVNLHPT